MGGQILLVEDDTDLGTTLQFFLELHGFRVSLVPDAESALRTLERASVDMLITDDQLPGLSGQGLAETLAGRGSSVPIIAFTGSDDTEGMESSGFFVGVLRKPCEPESLVHLVKRVFEHHAA
jgi:two-component system OmpR family response regulator/two-component system response regulator QseB